MLLNSKGQSQRTCESCLYKALGLELYLSGTRREWWDKNRNLGSLWQKKNVPAKRVFFLKAQRKCRFLCLLIQQREIVKKILDFILTFSRQIFFILSDTWVPKYQGLFCTFFLSSWLTANRKQTHLNQTYLHFSFSKQTVISSWRWKAGEMKDK